MRGGKRKAGKGRAGVYAGKVARDKAGHGNWFVGGFLPGGSLRHTKDVELKWTVHQGRHRDAFFKENLTATTACIIVRGGCTYEFEWGRKKRVVRLRAGDYVIWGPRVGHKLTVGRYVEIIVARWPSVDGDQRVRGKEIENRKLKIEK
jgi:hypothetical protein